MPKIIVGILVCNNQKILDHKMNDGKQSDGNYCYWEMPRFPNKILNIVKDQIEFRKVRANEAAPSPNTNWIYNFDDFIIPLGYEVRLYFAVDGQVKGYFIPEAIGEQDRVYELRFYSESWTPIKEQIKIKPSQGFRYFVHAEKSTEIEK